MSKAANPRACRFAVLAVAIGAAALARGAALAQPAPLNETQVNLTVDSGWVTARGEVLHNAFGLPAGEPEMVFSEVVQVPDAPWLRLTFDEVVLSGDPGTAPAGRPNGDGTILRLTSLADGAVQYLNALSVAQWGNSSAYFNGDAVLIEMLAHPGSGPSRLVMSSVTAGVQPPADPAAEPGADGGAASICFDADERELSDDPRDARTQPNGCSAYLHSTDHHCMITAGHCTGNAQVIEFNVPMSMSNGNQVFSHPDDQYPVDPESKQWQSAGVGNDWGCAGVFPNSNTGLTPLQAQGESYALAAAAPPVMGQQIRIRGYGTVSPPVDPTWNKAQKEHSGPYVLLNDTLVRYQVDTTNGNSGSAVFDLSTGLVIGVHTHAGCNSGGGSNRGTAIHHSTWQNALDNPQGVCAWPAPAPENDVCEQAVVVSDGEHPFTNLGASTTGPPEPGACGEEDDGQIHADVWFGYIATCTGTVTIGLCESSLRTRLALYDFQCPEEPGTALACDFGGCGNDQSIITWPLKQDQAVRIRIGGDAGSQGDGILSITCEPVSCAGDINGDGVVDTDDLLILLAEWGECDEPPGADGSCAAADIDGDGVVDAEDLLVLLATWGPCLPR